MEMFDLDRFVEAQDAYDSYNRALKEVRNGRKQSHWMWYVFPQIQGLGRSSTSQKYAIKSLLEAKAYIEHDILGHRLYEAVEALPVSGDAEDIFGLIDAMKLRSSLTLFDIVSPDEIFADILENYFDNKRCQRTLSIVGGELSAYKSGSAFKRYGVIAPVKAFFEAGSYEASQFNIRQIIGTFIDLLQRGETMVELVSQYFWEKDFLSYRVADVRHTILSYMLQFFREIADCGIDRNMVDVMNATYNNLLMSDENVLSVAVTFDVFLRNHQNDDIVKQAMSQLINESLCRKGFE